jgi:hypothetical protein
MSLQLQAIRGMDEVRQNFDTLSQQFPITARRVIPEVATLPSAASPLTVNGQVIHYIADATNGVVWQLRYRAASASTSKWECVGGSPLRTTTDADEATAVAHNVYQSLTTVLTITVPLPGDYQIVQWTNSYSATVPENPFLTVKIGAAVSADIDGASGELNTANTGVTFGTTRFKTGLAASTVLTQQAKAGFNNQTHFRTRGFSLMPVRVG